MAHLFLNTGPLIVLGGLILVDGRTPFVRSTVFIVLVGGMGIWLIGRPAYHVGASALIFGYFGYLLARGIFDRRLKSFFIALVAVAAYGGLFWGLLPTAVLCLLGGPSVRVRGRYPGGLGREAKKKIKRLSQG